MMEEKSNLYIVAIVAVVAVIALVVLVMNRQAAPTALSAMSAEDAAGQAYYKRMSCFTECTPKYINNCYSNTTKNHTYTYCYNSTKTVCREICPGMV